MNHLVSILLTLLIFSSCGQKHEDSKETEAPVKEVDESSRVNEIDENSSKVAQQMPVLNGTKWNLEIVEGAFNYYQFSSDSTYKYYSVEIEDTFYGSYVVNNDTLYLKRQISSADSLLSEDSPHRSMMVKQKLVAEGNSLLLIWQELKYGSGWKELDTPPNLYYMKE